MSESYDDICEKAKAEAEQRLIDHFQDQGGDVWNIRSGCLGCKTSANNVALKTCSQCKTALFCSKDCQKTSWKTHKHECSIISTLANNITDATIAQDTVAACLNTLSWSHDDKVSTDEAVLKAAKSIKMGAQALPGWFCTINFTQHPASQTEYIKAILQLYALLRDEQCWTRDTDSFPRSSYTFATTIPKTSSARDVALQTFLDLKGPLVIFTAWMQDPQPPAIQSIPFEKRLVYGLLDSLLQIEEIRAAIDDFMDATMG
ncbi:Aste57867_8992 [Aphanomyces stellatus]|uniref:Aste57867_8992 protein n=1 Tax=Aphanomyces stellatus TaxID=120398 RepID=A0A485KM22_9STRA|nr:hypothetical protein As57867_008957 [Aphanomyces stellatus]VFT85876.1 Aste57867_8992 [Aphanomyces stellatus]